MNNFVVTIFNRNYNCKKTIPAFFSRGPDRMFDILYLNDHEVVKHKSNLVYANSKQEEYRDATDKEARLFRIYKNLERI